MLSILAVDDSPISRQIYRSALAPHFNIELAESGEEAWDKIHRSRFDLIITDLNLPEISGLELVNKLRILDQYANIPVIVVSGDGEGIEQIKDANIRSWLLKPVKPKSLVKAVKAVISR